MAKSNTNTQQATPAATASPEVPATAQDHPACSGPIPPADQSEPGAQPCPYDQDYVDHDKATVMCAVINGVLAGRGSARDDLGNAHYRQRLADHAALVADEIIRRCTCSSQVCPGQDTDDAPTPSAND